MNIDNLVETYVQLRDAKDDLKKQHSEALKPYDEGMDIIEGKLLSEMQRTGADSFKTKHGTAYKTAWTTARVADWSAVLDYAITNERFDLFERRVNKTVVAEIGEVPGVAVDTGIKVNIRR